jgi:hypothetical protein
MPSRATPYIQDFETGPPGNHPLNEAHHGVGIGVIAVGVQLEIFLPKPLLEPLRHRVPLTGAICREVEREL